MCYSVLHLCFLLAMSSHSYMPIKIHGKNKTRIRDRPKKNVWFIKRQGLGKQEGNASIDLWRIIVSIVQIWLYFEWPLIHIVNQLSNMLLMWPYHLCHLIIDVIISFIEYIIALFDFLCGIGHPFKVLFLLLQSSERLHQCLMSFAWTGPWCLMVEGDARFFC